MGTALRRAIIAAPRTACVNSRINRATSRLPGGYGYRWFDNDDESGTGSSEFVYDVLTEGPQLGLAFHFQEPAIKDPIPADGPCIFTGRTAIYFGSADQWDDQRGHLLVRDQPLPVCDKTAANLKRLARPDILVTASTWFYDGGGCC